MKGYGDLQPGGLGYGDPTSSNPILERGYGSPSFLDDYYITLSHNKLYHSGGAELVINGLIFDHLAPYQAFITTSDGLQYFHSGLAGQGFNLYPSRGLLICYSPPAPVGNYTLTLKYGTNLYQSTSIDIVYVHDNRGIERYQTAHLFPQHYNTGARASELDPLSTGETVPDEPFLVCLTNTIGRVFQEIGGVATSITSERVMRGESILPLESVLGFKESGSVWINRELFKYTIVNTTLVLDEPLRTNIEEGTQVKHHVI